MSSQLGQDASYTFPQMKKREGKKKKKKKKDVCGYRNRVV